ncbi:hypothetical protein T492DRAFT_885187 [Pavlovales sp. CCMP2436]|nr:hypothetical protein T492DRAFT_885187 [Pavlovales sp. CCMP2436]
MRFRRMQLLLFAVSFAAGAVFMFTLGVLDGTLRERRRHAGELDAHAAGQDEQLGAFGLDAGGERISSPKTCANTQLRGLASTACGLS